MLRYTFDEWLQENQSLNIHMTMKLRESFSSKHTHDFYEILLVCENELLHSLDNKTQLMSKYDICLIHPEQQHCALAPKQNAPSPSYFTMAIESSHFEKLATTIIPDFLQRVEDRPYISIDPQLHHYCRQTFNKTLSLPHADTQAQQHLYQLTIAKLIIELASQKASPKNEPDLIKRATLMMKDPDNMNLSIKEIAQSLGYSQEYFIRFFKNHNAESPNKLFTKIKLEYACELLCKTDYTILKICETIGFYSLNYFNHLFKNYFGESPTQYRKKHAIFI